MARTTHIPRCSVDTPLSTGASIELDKATTHHLSTVLRLKAGSTVVLFNGDGKNYTATLHIEGKRAVAEVITAADNTCESPLQTVLLQGISRGDRMDATIQKAVELGVNRIVPVYTRHAIRPLDAKRTERKREHWQQIATSALEQSGRASRVAIDEPCPLADALHLTGFLAESATEPAAAEAQRLSVVLTPEARDTLVGIVNRAAPLGAVALLIGPESGLDDDEVALAVESGWTMARLGPRILRTETAGMAALATLQALSGDFADGAE